MILELSDVHKSYASPDGEQSLEVLRGIDLAVESGESLAVVGPSGSGKSTLLNLMGALDRPTAGEVRFRGERLSEVGEKGLAGLRNREIGFVFQLHHLLPQLTVLENVLLPTLPAGRGGDPEADERARRLLGRVGLGERLHHRPAELSGGERQRTALVRALINRPSLLLADEPTGSLDAAASGALGDLLAELNREEAVTLVVVTHSDALARRMGRRLELRSGRLEAAGPDPREASGQASGRAQGRDSAPGGPA